MRAVYYITATGEIIEVRSFQDGTPLTVVDDWVGAGMAYALDDTATIEDHYYPAGVKTDRPELYAFSEVVIDADGVINVDFLLPTSTVVSSSINETVYTSVAAEHFQFKTAKLGEWDFQFDPPWPAKPLTLRIVSNAF